MIAEGLKENCIIKQLLIVSKPNKVHIKSNAFPVKKTYYKTYNGWYETKNSIQDEGRENHNS